MRNSNLMDRVRVMTEAVFSLLDGFNKNKLLSFPRDIEGIITFGVEVPVITQPKVTLPIVNNYLCALGGLSVTNSLSDNRKLQGLLHVGFPCTIIFICANLPQPVKSYVLAHELGHLLADVFLVKQLWLKSLPEKQEAIKRYFNWEDTDPLLELRAFIKGLPLRPQLISGRGQDFAPETSDREIIADLFAREIIAPWDIVSSLYKMNSKREFADLLRKEFNLPLRIGANYYDDIENYLNPKPSLFDRIFTSFQN